MLGSSGSGNGCWLSFDHCRDECSRPSAGHTNEKNFVGLSVTADGYIATGSEDNSVVAYHASLPLPVARHPFAPAPGAHPYSISTEPARQFCLWCASLRGVRDLFAWGKPTSHSPSGAE